VSRKKCTIIKLFQLVKLILLFTSSSPLILLQKSSDVIPAKAGIQVLWSGSRLPPGQRLDTGACPGPDPGFAGVTKFERFAKTSIEK
jgi:hypothetical protein